MADVVGVSPRTVSRVVNDEGGFSSETRERVLEVIRELNYHPNVHARSLISGRSGSIGFVAPVLSDPFFPELAEGVQRAAHAAGLTVLLSMSDHDEGRQHDVLASLEGHRLDGIIVFPIGDLAGLNPFLERGVNLVPVDTMVRHRHARSVLSDLEGGTVAAIERLLGRGCRHLAMINASEEPPERRRRRDAFVQAVPGEVPHLVIDVTWTMEGGRRAADRIIDDHPDVDGIFAYNDVMALGAMQTIQRRGLRIPEDIAVIGCDDIMFASGVTPSLTTIRIDRAQLGFESVRSIVELADGATEL
ncbi:MAG: LacI family DNA-binding transcriptional regulator, partial [Ilumatobacter sp.]